MAPAGEPAASSAGKSAAEVVASAEAPPSAGEPTAEAAASAEASPSAGEPAAEGTSSAEPSAASESAGASPGRPGTRARPRSSGRTGRSGRSGRAGTAGPSPEDGIIHHRGDAHSRPKVTPAVPGPPYAVQKDPKCQQYHQQHGQIQHQHIQRGCKVAIRLGVVAAAVGIGFPHRGDVIFPDGDVIKGGEPVDVRSKVFSTAAP